MIAGLAPGSPKIKAPGVCGVLEFGGRGVRITGRNAEGYLKNGPVSVAKFELGEDDDTREARALRQREAANVIELLLNGIDTKE
jgi:hypothetical protein